MDDRALGNRTLHNAVTVGTETVAKLLDVLEIIPIVF